MRRAYSNVEKGFPMTKMMFRRTQTFVLIFVASATILVIFGKRLSLRNMR